MRLDGRSAGRSLAADIDRISVDTVCVLADFVLWQQDRATLARLADALRPDKVLLFVEPTAELGWRRALHRVTRRLSTMVPGYNFECDVPAELRAAGLVVTTTDRFSTGPAGIASYVWGQAQHFTH